MKWQKKRPANEESEPPALSAGKPGVGDAEKAMGSDVAMEFLPSSWRHNWLLGLLLVAVILMAYQPVWHAGFIWDDDEFLTDKPVIKSVDFKSADCLYRVWFTTSLPDYYPMTASMLWLEWRLWANNPLGYHLANVLLHALSAILLWRVLQRLNLPGALLAASLFALHPVNVESVAWISEGKNTLCMFFYLGTLLFWLKFEDSGRRRWYGLALAGFALALFSKSAVAPWPVVLLGIAWWRRGRLEWKDVRRAAPFFVMAAAVCWVTVWFHYHRAIGNEVIRTDGFWSRLAGAGWAVWFYLYKAVLPLNLAFVYPRWQINARNMLSYIPLVLLAAAFVLCWRWRRGWGRGLFFGLAYFVVMLLPVLGFLNIYFMRYSLVADHWQYFAIIGPIALAAAIIRRPVVAAALLLALGALTWKQCGMYAKVETLWQTTLRLNPNCWMAHGNLGDRFAQLGRIDEAIAQYQQALEMKPDLEEARRNLGVSFSKLGRMDEAISEYKKALEIQPDDVETHVNLGNIYCQLGQMDEAILHYRKALEIQPDNAEAHVDLGNSFLQLGRMNEAIPQYQKALEIKPRFAEAENNLGACLYHQGRMDEAIAHYQKAVGIKPDYANARLNLGKALQKKESFGEAIAQFQKALQLEPADPAIQSSLAWLLATCPDPSLRNGNKAVELAQKANERAGGRNPVFLHTLAAAFAEAGRFGDAVQSAQKAIELARAAGQQEVAAHLEDELKRYEAGLPLHQ
jgi:tetratricopeptide (TPR) repeat protein